MSRHIPIVAFLLLVAVVATLADDSKSASAPAPDSSSDDLPDALTPFAVSPSVAATIAEGPSSGDDDIENDPDAGTDGAPASADQYPKLDKKYSHAAPLGPSAAAAAASVAAAAAGCLLF